MSDQQIRATFDEFTRAWNAHDVAAMAACWTASGNAVDLWGRLAVGHDGVVALLGGEHAGPMRESRYRVDDIRVRSLSEESAVVECDAYIEGVIAPNGRVYELAHRIDAIVADAGDGQWRFVTLHPSFTRA
jgi:uncharacterized protein (TIGR02246 family)